MPSRAATAIHEAATAGTEAIVKAATASAFIAGAAWGMSVGNTGIPDIHDADNAKTIHVAAPVEVRRYILQPPKLVVNCYRPTQARGTYGFAIRQTVENPADNPYNYRVGAAAELGFFASQAKSSVANLKAYSNHHVGERVISNLIQMTTDHLSQFYHICVKYGSGMGLYNQYSHEYEILRKSMRREASEQHSMPVAQPVVQLETYTPNSHPLSEDELAVSQAMRAVMAHSNQH
jgi:hypothetical protein